MVEQKAIDKAVETREVEVSQHQTQETYRFHRDGWEHVCGTRRVQQRAAEILQRIKNPEAELDQHQTQVPRHARRLIDMLQKTLAAVDFGAEIGVCRGETSHALLEAFPALTLVMVDPWKEIPDKAPLHGDQMSGQSQSGHDDSRRLAYACTQPYRDRRIIIEKTSLEAAFCVASHLDFVFIDALHIYEAVKQDIQSWSHHVRAGGVLCGHDYGHRRFPGVTRAVDEVAAQLGKTVQEHGARIWSLA